MGNSCRRPKNKLNVEAEMAKGGYEVPNSVVLTEKINHNYLAPPKEKFGVTQKCDTNDYNSKENNSQPQLANQNQNGKSKENQFDVISAIVIPTTEIHQDIINEGKLNTELISVLEPEKKIENQLEETVKEKSTIEISETIQLKPEEIPKSTNSTDSDTILESRKFTLKKVADADEAIVQENPGSDSSNMKENFMLRTLEIHEAAQNCLSSIETQIGLCPNESEIVKELTKEEKQENCKRVATKYAETIVSDILSLAQSKSLDQLESRSTTSQMSLETIMLKIHEICQNSLLNKTNSQLKPILMSETERQETLSALRKLIQNLMGEPSSSHSMKLNEPQIDTSQSEPLKRILEIHEGAQATLKTSENSSPKSSSPGGSSSKQRKQRSAVGPKISVSFADGKEYLQTPSKVSPGEFNADEDVIEDSGPTSPKSRIMNRRPTGPFLPQLDKFNFKEGVNVLKMSREAQEEEDEDEDEDEDDGINFVAPVKPQRSKSDSAQGSKDHEDLDDPRRQKNLVDLIALFEDQPRRSSK